jgi:hypothetical protein
MIRVIVVIEPTVPPRNQDECAGFGNPDSCGLFGSFSPAARGTGRLKQSCVETIKGKWIKWDAFFIVADFPEKTDVILNPGSFFKGK